MQRAQRAELIDPLIAQHGGRIANTAGDSLLIEFPSAVEAVRCAVAVQDGMRARNATVPEDRRILYRVGINVGDVVSMGHDLLGDGVNIAARLEGLATPGGVVLSGTVHDQVRDRLNLDCTDLGEVEVKNIARPVRAFQVLSDGEAAVQVPRTGKRRWSGTAAVAALLILIAGVSYWYMQRPEFEPADPAKMAYDLTDKPSIAVLAFDNLTGDAEQEHISDGISEDIIAALARLPGLLVIARNSSFAYKGQAVDIRQIAEEQSVRYVLEGSLQQSDDTLRITAQLIDAVSGHHVWSKKYDRPRADFFKVRDEITHAIIAELNSELIEGRGYWAALDTYGSMDTWLLARRATWHHQRWNAADNQISIDLMHEILESEPDSAGAHHTLAFRHAANGRLGWTHDRAESFRKALYHAEKAISSDPEYPGGYIAKAWLLLAQGKLTEGIVFGDKALELAPGDSTVLAILGILYQKDMQAERAVSLFERAVRVDPRASGWVWENYGEALQMAGRNEEAIPVFQTGLKFGKGFIATELHVGLAVSFDALGRDAEARAAIQDAIKATPDVTVAYMRQFQRYKDVDYMDRWLATLKRLGLPEE
jgi:TolB-like protein/Tfp pilus assembly protein PilF